ncbi:anion permease [Campylobacter upsaliensis]
MSKNKILSLLFCLAVLGVFYLTPVPVGLEANSWHFLGLFAAVILAVILQVMPLGAICLIAIVALSGIITPQSQIRAAHIKSLQGIMIVIMQIRKK